MVIDVAGQVGEFDAGASRQQIPHPETLQMRLVRREPIVLGAGSKLDVLAQQVEHPTELARGVVARGAAVTVIVGTHPAGLCTLRMSVAASGVSVPRRTSIVLNTASYSVP